MDNSPRFDGPLARVQVGTLPAYRRRDTAHIGDTSQRPSDAEYDRFLWLVKLLKDAHYDDAEAQRTLPLLVADVFFSGIFAAANHALVQLGTGSESPPTGPSWRTGPSSSPPASRANGTPAPGWRWIVDLRAERADPACRRMLASRRCSCRSWTPGCATRWSDALFGPRFAGADGFKFRVIPSAAPGSPGFDRRSYWRGPTWPVMNWLFWWALRQQGEERSRRRAAPGEPASSCEQPGSRFAEYLEPYTGEPLGSMDQSWTAAVALDWLAVDGAA